MGDIGTARRFYAAILGFEVTGDKDVALFVSAGGYHHHIGINTFNSVYGSLTLPGTGAPGAVIWAVLMFHAQQDSDHQQSNLPIQGVGDKPGLMQYAIHVTGFGPRGTFECYLGGMWTLRGSGMGVSIMVAAALAGCSTPAVESRLDEYEERSEEIHAGMIEHVPGNGASEVRMTSQPQFGESEWLRAQERDVAFWTIWSTVEVAADATPAEAADAAGTFLLDRRWTVEPTVDQGGTMPFVTVYRLAEQDGEWIVQILRPADGDDRRISLLVQSPITVRGTTSRPG